MQKANQMRNSSLQLKTSLEKHMQISWYRRFDFFITSSADYPKGFCKRNRNAWLRFLIFPAALHPLQPLQPLTAYYDRERNSLSLFLFPEIPMLASIIFSLFQRNDWTYFYAMTVHWRQPILRHFIPTEQCKQAYNLSSFHSVFRE